MSGKGSRQRTYGSKFEQNWEKIFGNKHDTPVGGSQKPSKGDQGTKVGQPTGSR